MRIALDKDSDKARTIGMYSNIFNRDLLLKLYIPIVLTKPDTLTVGAISEKQKLHDLIAGEDIDTSHYLRYGYYCVKLSDDAERANNPTRAEREQAEQNFFASTPPWNEVNVRERFGIRNLVIDLSRHLTDLLDHT